MLLFVDFSKVFDAIHRGKIKQILRWYSFLKETLSATMMLYINMTAMVCLPEGNATFFWCCHCSFAKRYINTVLCIICLEWCNCYRRRKWTLRHEFKSCTRLIAFHIALIPLRKVWIQLFSLQLWVNSRTD